MWLNDLVRYPAGVFSMGDEGEAYDTYWEDRGRGVSESLSDWQRERAEFIIKTLKEHASVESLGDIGAGNGAVLGFLIKELRPKHAVAYEISPASLESLRESGIEAVSCDVRLEEDRKRIAPASVFLLLEVLEHMHDPEGLLAIAYEKADQGVFFSIPNTGFLTHRFRLLFGKVPLQWKRNPSEHVRFWTLVDLRWWLRILGYTHVHIHPYKGVPFLNKIWPNLFAEGLIVYLPKVHHV